MGRILLFWLVCTSSLLAQEDVFPFYEVRFFKLEMVNGKFVKRDYTIGARGITLDQDGRELKVPDFKSFIRSVSRLTSDEASEKIPGDNQKRIVRLRQPNQQDIFIRVVLMKDYYNEPELANRTIYAYRETGLPTGFDAYRFLRYFDEANARFILSLLKS